MKYKVTITLLVIFILALFLMSCGKKASEKDNLITSIKKTTELMKTVDLMKAMTDPAYGEKLKKQTEEIYISSGFKNEAEFNTVMEKYKDDPEIKKLTLEMTNAAFSKIDTNAIKNAFETALDSAFKGAEGTAKTPAGEKK